MNIVAIIQARMGSTRLPGKVMLPLGGEHVLTHDIQRAKAAETVDTVVVATSSKAADDMIAQYGTRAGEIVHRGSESNVLERIFQAAEHENADIVVRITGDCPLIDPDVIDEVVKKLVDSGADYSANIIERTFPRGLDVEAFTFDSLEQVYNEATEPHQLEHVTAYYYENDEFFDFVSVTSEETFDNPQMQNRTDLRLTLDEADDYELLRRVYDGVDWSENLHTQDALEYIDDNNLSEINSEVRHKIAKRNRE